MIMKGSYLDRIISDMQLTRFQFLTTESDHVVQLAMKQCHCQ